jgi:hypothetical protein
LSPSEMQTLTFTMLVFAGQGNVLCTHGRFWRSRPAPIMLVASITDLLVVASFASGGLLMGPLPIRVIALLVATTLVFTLAMDSIKLAVFARVRID